MDSHYEKANGMRMLKYPMPYNRILYTQLEFGVSLGLFNHHIINQHIELNGQYVLRISNINWNTFFRE